MYITREAHAVCRPVGLRESDLGLQYGDASAIVRSFAREMDTLVDLLPAEDRRRAEGGTSAPAYNGLGIRCAQFGRYERAETALRQALSLDREYLGAEIDLWNVLLLRNDYVGALDGLRSTYDKLVARQEGRTAMAQPLLVSMSQAHDRMGDYERAGDRYAEAAGIDAERVRELAYLGQRTDAGGGATPDGDRSEAQDALPRPLFSPPARLAPGRAAPSAPPDGRQAPCGPAL
jgi:tetratricopeptide (TPR) repeat protein